MRLSKGGWEMDELRKESSRRIRWTGYLFERRYAQGGYAGHLEQGAQSEK